MSQRSEAQFVSKPIGSGLHGLSFAKLSIKSDIGGFGNVTDPHFATPLALHTIGSGSETEEEDDPVAPPTAPPVAPSITPTAAESESEAEEEDDPVAPPTAPPVAPPTAPPVAPPAQSGPSGIPLRTGAGDKRLMERMENAPGTTLEWPDSDGEESIPIPIQPPRKAPRPMPPPLDVSNPEQGTWASRRGNGHAERLKVIALLFRNPKTLKDDDYMTEVKDIAQIRLTGRIDLRHSTAGEVPL